MKSKARTRIILFIVTLAMSFVWTSCSNKSPTRQNTGTTESTISHDREGNPITLPEKIESIISMGPSNSEILAALGFGERIIAADTYSEGIEGITQGIPLFSMDTPDGEQIINLQPDVIFVTGMTKAGRGDPFEIVSNAGICVIYIPSSTSIDGIAEDIRYISSVMGVESKGNEIIADMESAIESVRQKGDAITEEKSVYYEISAAPYMYSFGTGVFLNEMIEIIGARNILSNQESWVFIADEVILESNPDVILTSVNYIENPIDEIKSRPGWDGITAVKNGDIYYIDTDASNRPSHNIVKALNEMAQAIYPDIFR